ncbi:MAG: hypothetical protein IT380_21970 [Myxococcales bacterium]|nr:hypothetical protein [Myxococcales bacterium]
MIALTLALVISAAPEDAGPLCNQYGWLADLRERLHALQRASSAVVDPNRRASLGQRIVLLQQELDRLSSSSSVGDPRAGCVSLAVLIRDAWRESLVPDTIPPFDMPDCASPRKEAVLAGELARLQKAATSRKLDEPRRRRAVADAAQLQFEIAWMRSYDQCARARDGLFDLESLLLDGGELPSTSRLCRRPDWRAFVEARLMDAHDDPSVRKALARGSCEAAESALLHLQR